MEDYLTAVRTSRHGHDFEKLLGQGVVPGEEAPLRIFSFVGEVRHLPECQKTCLSFLGVNDWLVRQLGAAFCEHSSALGSVLSSSALCSGVAF